MEKDLNVGMLLEIYGELLTKTQAEILDRYYNLDTSLSEIASEFGIARQSVRDAIVKGRGKLEKFEASLKIYNRKNQLQDICSGDFNSSEAKAIAKAVLDVLEEE